MKTYDTNKIMVAGVGKIKYKSYKKTATPNEVIFIEDYCDNESYYKDMFSNKKYIIFDNASEGVEAVWIMASLTSYIIKACDKYPRLMKADIIKKIIDGKEITESELKKLKFALNSKQGDKILLTEDNLKSTKLSKNIKINYISNLTNKKYKLQPTIGRDLEIKDIFITLSLNNKATLLVGKRGVGKTSIINELAYRITKNNVPDFLKKEKIIELNMSALFIDTNTIEKKILNLIEIALKDNYIIFIDNIDSIKDYNILKLFKYAIEKNNLKVIATITSENDSKIYTDDIFNRIIVNEPTDEQLALIIIKVLNDYSKINNIKLGEGTEKHLTKILIDLTKLENRILSNFNNQPINYDMYNPGLVIEIIDRMFADAKTNNNKQLKIENVIYGINSCNKIKENTKKNILKRLESTLHTIEEYDMLKNPIFIKHL